MRNFKKILAALTVILALVCVFAVAAFATEYKIPVRDGWEGPMGIIKGETGWQKSGYTDIDDHVNFTNGEKDVWVQIATNDTSSLKSLTGESADLAYGNNYYAYFNEYERKVVIVAQGNLHSQLRAHTLQDTPEEIKATMLKYALYDKIYNLYALEYVFTQDAYKDISVPGLDMTWAEYMSSKVKTADIFSFKFPSSANDSSTEEIIVLERAVANALYTAYSANSTYAAAFAEAGSPSTLTGSTYTPATNTQKMSRALLTGLMLWVQENSAYADTVSALTTAAKTYAADSAWKYYALKGTGSSFGWKGGMENYFGQYGYVAMAFLINTNTSENANVGCLGAYVDTLELRNPGSSTRNFQNFGSVTAAFDETTTVLVDTKLITFQPESNAALDRGLFRQMESLTTLAHVSFGTNGKYTDTVKSGIVDLSGFTTVSRKEYCYTGYILYDSDSVTDVIWYETMIWSGNDKSDVSGVIYDYAMAYCASLKTLTIPANANVPLSKIGTNVFVNSSIKDIYVLRAVSDDFTIASTAFSGCSGVTMYVLDKTSAANAVAALSKAGIKNVSVDLYNPIENPVSFEGALVKMEDFTSASSDKLAIRFQFIWEEKGAAAQANIAQNYTFKGLGIIASTAATYDSYEATVLSETGLASASLVAQEMLSASAGENSKVVNVLVTNADFTDGRRTFLKGYDIDAGYFPFCLSLYGMTGDQITSEYYVAAYTEWADESGNTFYTFTTLDYVKDDENKNSISLYDTTLGLVKQGLLNSSDYASAENAEKYFYSVLEKGALTTSSFTEHTLGANKGYTDLLNADGSFTYWKVDYRKYVLDPSFPANSALSANVNVGYGYRPDTTEAVPTSGVQWSILKDGAGYVVILTKNTAAAPEGVTYDYKVPTSGRNSQYAYYQPFHYQYGDVNHGKDTNAKLGSMTVYSPAISKAVFNAITTIVVDDGIVALDKDSLANFSPVTTMVLPESCTVVEAYAIAKNGKLTDIIWTGDPDAKSESKYNVEHLYDLRGCSTVNNGSLLCDNYAAVNVVTQNGVNVDGQLTFNKANALIRYWSASGYSGYTMPAAGTIDVSKGWHNNINKGYFNAGSNITTIIVKATLKSSHNAFTSSEDDRSYAAYGTKQSYNFILVDDSGNKVDYVWKEDGKTDTVFLTYLYNFIKDLHAGAKAAQAANCDNLSVNGVSVKTLFPDLFS